MALRNYNTKEENEMQDLTQKQIDLAGFSEKGFSQEQINQIYEYAQMVGDELKVRNLIWRSSIGFAHARTENLLPSNRWNKERVRQ